MKKRVMALAFCLMLVLSAGLPKVAFARASDYLSTYRILVVPKENGVVQVSATVNGTHSRMTRIGFPVINLYEVDGDTATVVKCLSSQYNYNAGSHGVRYDYQGTIGKEYYAYASFGAEDENGGDSRSLFSASIIAKK